jgi:hypothetical protein
MDPEPAQDLDPLVAIAIVVSPNGVHFLSGFLRNIC